MDMIMCENESADSDPYQTIENFEIILNQVFGEIDLNEVHITKIDKCKHQLFLAFNFQDITSYVTQDVPAFQAELKGLAKDGSISRYQIQEMIQYIQNKVISGELDTGIQENQIYSSQHGNQEQKNHPQQLSLNLSGIQQNSGRNPNTGEDLKLSALRIKGDFKLEGTQQNVDLQ